VLSWAAGKLTEYGHSFFRELGFGSGVLSGEGGAIGVWPAFIHCSPGREFSSHLRHWEPSVKADFSWGGVFDVGLSLNSQGFISRGAIVLKISVTDNQG
jgi:hypothetical protein